MSDRQLNHYVWLLPQAVYIEELEDVHLVPKHSLPQDVGGKEVHPKVRHDLAPGYYQEKDKIPCNL